MLILTYVDLNGNEVRNARVQNLATAPANPVEGQAYWNTADKALMLYNGTDWQSAGSTYVLPPASAATLGGVKIGNGVSAAADGTLAADVLSVAGKTGAVTLDKADVGLGNVDNTSDANKPISTAVQTALDAKQDELTFDSAPTSGSTNPVTSGGVYTALEGKQDTLVSGTDIKTINGDSILAAGDLELATKAELGDYLELAGGTMTGNIAMGGNAITGLGDPTNNGDAATKGYVDANVVGALKPSGSVTFANLPALGASVLNNIYNVEDAFTTTADFVEGAGVSFPAGTNVAIINVGSDASPVYKYDAYTGTIDTSGFATKTEVNGLIVSATGTIDTSSTSVTVAYTGTLIGFYATQNGQRVVTDVTISAAGVTFTCAAAPTSAVTCTVVSAGSLS